MPWGSESCPWTAALASCGGLVRNAESWSPPQTYWFRACILTRSQGDLLLLKWRLEKHWTNPRLFKLKLAAVEPAEGSAVELPRADWRMTGNLSSDFSSHEAVHGKNFGPMLEYLLCTKTNGLSTLIIIPLTFEIYEGLGNTWESGLIPVLELSEEQLSWP